MPLRSNSAGPTIIVADATAEVKAAAVPEVATNNQPDMVLMDLAHSNPCILSLPTSIGRIGTTD
jgi:hypothetical protein